jgi:predicted enzyme related to lactoylglutathione lyase
MSFGISGGSLGWTDERGGRHDQEHVARDLRRLGEDVGGSQDAAAVTGGNGALRTSHGKEERVGGERKEERAAAGRERQMGIKGQFVWYELLTADPDAAKVFYGAVMGWKSQPWEGDAKPYAIWTSGDTPFGGVMKLLPEWELAGEKPHWWAHVAVDDVDAAAQRAKQLGGEIRVPPTDIPQVGRFSIIADPQGAVLSLFRSNRDERPSFDRRKPGFVGWHELTTTDHESAWKFYRELFGWQHTSDFDMGTWGLYFMFRHPDDPETVSMGGMFNGSQHLNMPPRWLYYVNVEGIDDALARVRDNGGTVLRGPTEVPGGGKVAQCRDPQGALFAIFSMK